MKRGIRAAAILVISAALLLMLGACGKSEAFRITGRLLNASEGTITVSSDAGPVEIDTGKETVAQFSRCFLRGFDSTSAMSLL